MNPPSIRIRVSALIRNSDQVLLVKHRKQEREYWLLPGGGLEVGETLVEGVKREVREETGYAVVTGKLLLVCESIEPKGRHILNMVFGAEVSGGEFHPAIDGSLVDAAWHRLSDLNTLEMYPRIGEILLECCSEDLRGDTRFLGNVWS